VRLSVPPAIGWFLIKLTPYCPEQMLSSFFNSIPSVYDQSISPIVIAVYAFLSRIVAPPFHSQYFQFSAIAPHFSVDVATFSEHIAPIIESLHHLGIEWLHELLLHLIKQISSSPSSHLIHAISTLISFDPHRFFGEILNAMQPNLAEYLPMFAFLFVNHPCDVTGHDISPLIARSLEILADEAATGNDSDSALQFLSVCPHLSISVDSAFFVINISNRTVSIPQEKLLGRSYFYRLPLSLDLLRPQESDKPSLLSCKFETLAKLANRKEELRPAIRALFYETLDKPWDDTVSAALRGLAACINSIGIHHGFLRELLASPRKSWLHGLDLLAVIAAVDVATICEPLCGDVDLSCHTNTKLTDSSRLASIAAEFLRALQPPNSFKF
jgi:hypothetical protein